MIGYELGEATMNAYPRLGADLVRWLLEEGRAAADPRSLLRALIDRLHAGDVPVSRLAIGLATLHPEVVARRYVWDRGNAFVHEEEVPRGMWETDAYRVNPAYDLVVRGATLIRRRLDADESAFDYPVLAEFRDRGYTDYVGMPLPLTGGRIGTYFWCADRPGGFSDEEIAALEAIRAPLGLLCDVHDARGLTRSLLNLYLGRDAGRRVLTGEIRRGAGRSVRSALWYCDLRGFTALSERVPSDVLIAVLNDYFEAMARPVHAHGGEILKLIGDAMLAIFPIDGEDEAVDVCQRALAAAELAAANMAILNRRREREGKPVLRFGLALHVGDAIYGNVGAPSRLDFTVIGPAVNLVARMEALAGELGLAIVASPEFVSRSGAAARSLGRHPLKGISEAPEVFAII
jgi:adenylate cyclase